MTLKNTFVGLKVSDGKHGGYYTVLRANSGVKRFDIGSNVSAEPGGLRSNDTECRPNLRLIEIK